MNTTSRDKWGTGENSPGSVLIPPWIQDVLQYFSQVVLLHPRFKTQGRILSELPQLWCKCGIHSWDSIYPTQLSWAMEDKITMNLQASLVPCRLFVSNKPTACNLYMQLFCLIRFRQVGNRYTANLLYNEVSITSVITLTWIPQTVRAVLKFICNFILVYLSFKFHYIWTRSIN